MMMHHVVVLLHISVLAGRWCFPDQHAVYLTFCKNVKMESSFILIFPQVFSQEAELYSTH